MNEITDKGPANALAMKYDADVVLFAGPMWPENDFLFLNKIRALGAARRKNIFLVLATYGGLPDTAFRIARFVRQFYDGGKMILFVPSDCMSAGSLVAIGADEIVMSDEARLGPIDMQLRDRDEVGEYSSGLTPMQALDALRGESWSIFQELFKKLRERESFSTKQASSIAARMAIGLLRPMYSQLDPSRIAQNQRAIAVATGYANRIKSGNVHEVSISRLVAAYPSHDFVIDRQEVQKLFKVVKEAGEEELKLAAQTAEIIKETLAKGLEDTDAVVLILSDSMISKGNENDNETSQRSSSGGENEGGSPSGESAGRGPRVQEPVSIPAASISKQDTKNASKQTALTN